MAFDIFGLNANQVITSHSASDCEPPCPLHSPSDHPLNAAPLQWRSDRRIFERICPHGIGHNDPDSTAYNRRHGLPADDTHGCDGCCVGLAIRPGNGSADVWPVHRPQPRRLHSASAQRSPVALRLRRKRAPREAS